MPDIDTPVLQLRGVTKAYDGVLAVSDASFSVHAHQVVGLLGPNGAGKTTLMRMINRITMPDAGQVLYCGRPIQASDMGQVGFLPEERGLYKKMRVLDHLVLLFRLKDMPKADAKATGLYWLERMGLADWKDRKVEELSKGMQQKIQFIAAVGHKPKLLVLDEPFSGLDPINAEVLQDIFVELRNQGAAILFSTHRMEQVEEFCEQIVLINKGQVLLTGGVRETRLRYRKPVFLAELDEDLDLTQHPLPPGVELEPGAWPPHTMALRAHDPATRATVLGWLAQHAQVSRFEHYTPSLKDIFIETVKGPDTHAVE